MAARMNKSVEDRLRARPPSPGESILSAVDPSSTPGASKTKATSELEKDGAKLEELQERLYAEGRRSLLLVLQGMDTSGKDGTISHVIRAMNPQGCKITAFKKPTPEERKHGFLWRVRRALPPPRFVGVFNRSHYEEVGIVRVHHLVPERVWRARYVQINNFEKEVSRRGTKIVKVFLHISFEEQARRLLARLDNPKKHWKFDPTDVAERDHWDEYMAAYDEAIARCSTEIAPWYVVPADHKWYRNWAVTRLLIETMKGMDPQYPQPKLDIKALKARIKSQHPA
jgi:PPK2 family polyphosphate:nucleotide phosphotransferase